MGSQTLVIQARPRLPTMAIPHTRLGSAPSSLPRPYVRHASRRKGGESGLQLQHRDRARGIRLEMSARNLQRLVVAMDDEFLTLEYLVLRGSDRAEHQLDVFPDAFFGHRTHSTSCIDFTAPIPSPLVATCHRPRHTIASRNPSSAYFHPNDLLQRLSLMPQIETLIITFHSPFPAVTSEATLRMPPRSHVTLPNLPWLVLKDANAYVEKVVSQITTPALEQLEIMFFSQLSHSVPQLLDFMSTTETLRFTCAVFEFHEQAVIVRIYLRTGVRMYALCMQFGCRHLDWQVAYAAQIFNELRAGFSTMEHLALKCERYFYSIELER
ncbi:hypothetical protein F5148DRAFT_118044 [Russula earlei]|uniref:Uncharacterized protein n=1 Tax=Russula earlei TaxID=71964 RepID=A0ACC0U6S3_9AGAM|nr:hypothetical protein F5148DRAFT_118044 [Russula earlei]